MATTPEAFSRAVGASMRAEIAAAGLNVAGVAKQMGISRPVLTNYIAGVRSAPISVIQRLAEVLEIQPDTIVRRAQERLADAERQAIQAAAADAPAGRVIKMAVVPELPNRGSLPRKLNLLVAAMPADRRTADIFQVVQGALTEQGIAILKRDWEAVLAGESVVTLSDEALGVIAKLFAVNPSYLTDNDPNLEESVDAKLEFAIAMHDLDVQEVAARSVGGLSPADLRELTATIRAAVHTAEDKRASIDRES